MKKIIRAILPASLCLCLACPQVAQALDRQYEFVDLGVLGSSSDESTPLFSIARAINESGVAVGESGGFPSAGQAFEWTNPSMGSVGLPASTAAITRSWASDINDNGYVVGVYEEVFQGPGVNTTYGFVSSGGSATSLFEFQPRKINNSGLAIGSFASGANAGREGIWQSGLTDVTGLAFAADLNNSGDVVGSASFSGGLQAALLSNGQLSELPALGGHSLTEAAAINDLGEIVGWSAPGSGSKHLVKWSSAGVFDLGQTPDEQFQITAFNMAGQAVGKTNSNASLWENGEFVDLNTFLPGNTNWHLASAEDVNELGQIVGFGYLDGIPVQRAYLLNPVVATPEPVSSVLFLAGGASLFLMRRRKP